MFNDDNFMVNKESDEYIRRHPSERPKRYQPKHIFEDVNEDFKEKDDLISKQARIYRL